MTDNTELVERLKAKTELVPEAYVTGAQLSIDGFKLVSRPDPLSQEAATALTEAAKEIERLRGETIMAAERLSVHAQRKGKTTEGDYLRSSMAAIAGDLFRARQASPPGKTKRK